MNWVDGLMKEVDELRAGSRLQEDSTVTAAVKQYQVGDGQWLTEEELAGYIQELEAKIAHEKVRADNAEEESSRIKHLIKGIVELVHETETCVVGRKKPAW